ncbi:RNA polymerase sigma factor region1.1 domain-containing protein [Acidobacteria bacterium AH-259-D05]|nr:RNA polymerase sigma factor region1.1 domain-containing protein [Acidobacteria bacterium AH-259-D05]
MSVEDKYDGLRELINLGREKGYLVYNEMREMLPDDIHSSEDVDNICYFFGDAGIEVMDSEQQPDMVKQKIHSKAEEDEESDLRAEAAHLVQRLLDESIKLPSFGSHPITRQALMKLPPSGHTGVAFVCFLVSEIIRGVR